VSLKIAAYNSYFLVAVFTMSGAIVRSMALANFVTRPSLRLILYKQMRSTSRDRLVGFGIVRDN
jgi:hypothetical protein